MSPRPPVPNPEADGKTAAELTATHTAYLGGREQLARLSKQRRNAVTRARAEGWSVYRIARYLGIHDNVVTAIIKAAEKAEKETGES